MLSSHIHLGPSLLPQLVNTSLCQTEEQPALESRYTCQKIGPVYTYLTHLIWNGERNTWFKRAVVLDKVCPPLEDPVRRLAVQLPLANLLEVALLHHYGGIFGEDRLLLVAR